MARNADRSLTVPDLLPNRSPRDEKEGSNTFSSHQFPGRPALLQQPLRLHRFEQRRQLVRCPSLVRRNENVEHAVNASDRECAEVRELDASSVYDFFGGESGDDEPFLGYTASTRASAPLAAI